MRTETLLRQLEGIQTISSVISILKVNRKKAVYYIHRLRTLGYVKTRRLSDGIRVYNISFTNRLRGTSYYEIINKYSPVKISIPAIYNIYGREPSFEETLIFAIKTKSLRTVLAALALFKRIKNWSSLYHMAKQNHIERQVGALYDLAKELMRVRKMPIRFRKNALPKIYYQYRYIIPGLKSKNFKRIEEMWKIYLPFNKEDLEVYK